MRSVWKAVLVLVPCWAGALAAQQTVAMRDANTDELVRLALAAAPKDIAIGATVVMPTPDGKMTELKHGVNGWTCIPDNPDSPGKDPMCMDAEGLKWAQAWMAHEDRPGNTAPGLIYMLKGGSDISATDPWAKADKNTQFVTSPAHYMIMWPFDAKTSGLSDKPKQTGTWIMWAGTPWAHLMINQTP